MSALATDCQKVLPVTHLAGFQVPLPAAEEKPRQSLRRTGRKTQITRNWVGNPLMWKDSNLQPSD